MRDQMARLTTTFAMVLIPGIANAHPDHLTGVYNVAHYFTEPFHVGLISVGVVLAIATARYVRRGAPKMERSPH
jgi:hypothetical protein